jgi:hypothetical protein
MQSGWINCNSLHAIIHGFTFITKREQRPITLREEKKGEQLRTTGPYGERSEDWGEEGSEGGGRELREET